MDIWFFLQKIVFFVILFRVCFSTADILEEYQPNDSNPKQLNDFLDAVLKHKSDFKWIQQRNKDRHRQLTRDYKNIQSNDDIHFLDKVSKLRFHNQKANDFHNLMDRNFGLALDDDDRRKSRPFNDVYPYAYSNQDNQDSLEEDYLEETEDERHVRDIRRPVPKMFKKKFAKLNRMRRNVDYYDEDISKQESNSANVDIKTRSNVGNLMVAGDKLPERKFNKYTIPNSLDSINVKDYNKDNYRKFTNDYDNSEEELTNDKNNDENETNELTKDKQNRRQTYVTIRQNDNVAPKYNGNNENNQMHKNNAENSASLRVPYIYNNRMVPEYLNIPNNNYTVIELVDIKKLPRIVNTLNNKAPAVKVVSNEKTNIVSDMYKKQTANDVDTNYVISTNQDNNNLPNSMDFKQNRLNTYDQVRKSQNYNNQNSVVRYKQKLNTDNFNNQLMSNSLNNINYNNNINNINNNNNNNIIKTTPSNGKVFGVHDSKQQDKIEKGFEKLNSVVLDDNVSSSTSVRSLSVENIQCKTAQEQNKPGTEIQNQNLRGSSLNNNASPSFNTIKLLSNPVNSGSNYLKENSYNNNIRKAIKKITESKCNDDTNVKYENNAIPMNSENVLAETDTLNTNQTNTLDDSLNNKFSSITPVNIYDNYKQKLRDDVEVNKNYISKRYNTNSMLQNLEKNLEYLQENEKNLPDKTKLIPYTNKLSWTNGTFFEPNKYVVKESPHNEFSRNIKRFEMNPSDIEIIKGPEKFKSSANFYRNTNIPYIKRNIHHMSNRKNKHYSSLINDRPSFLKQKIHDKYFMYDNVQFIPGYRSRQLKGFEEEYKENATKLTRKKRSSFESFNYDYYEPVADIFKRSETEYMEEQEPVNSQKISIHYHEKKTNNTLANPSNQERNDNINLLNNLNYETPTIMRIRHYPKDDYFYIPRVNLNTKYQQNYKNLNIDDGVFSSRNNLISEENQNKHENDDAFEKIKLKNKDENFLKEMNLLHFNKENKLFQKRASKEDTDYDDNEDKIEDNEDKRYDDLEKDLESMKEILEKDSLENDNRNSNYIHNLVRSMNNEKIMDIHDDFNKYTGLRSNNNKQCVEINKKVREAKSNLDNKNKVQNNKVVEVTKAVKYFSKILAHTERYVNNKNESKHGNNKEYIYLEEGKPISTDAAIAETTTDSTNFMISAISRKVADDAYALAKLKYMKPQPSPIKRHKRHSDEYITDFEALDRPSREDDHKLSRVYRYQNRNGLDKFEDKYDLLSKTILNDLNGNYFLNSLQIEKNSSSSNIPTSTIMTVNFKRSKRSPSLSYSNIADKMPVSQNEELNYENSDYEDKHKYGTESLSSRDDYDEDDDYDYKKISQETTTGGSGESRSGACKNCKHGFQSSHDKDKEDDLESRLQLSSWTHHGHKNKNKKKEPHTSDLRKRKRYPQLREKRRHSNANRETKQSYDEQKNKIKRQNFSKIEEKYPWMKMGGVTIPYEYRQFSERLPRHNRNKIKKRHKENTTSEGPGGHLNTTKKDLDMCREGNVTTPVSILSIKTEDPKEANLLTNQPLISTTVTTTTELTIPTPSVVAGGLEEVEDGHLASRIVTKVKGELNKSEKLKKFADGLSEKYSKIIEHICFDFLHVDNSAFEGAEELLEKIKTVLAKLVDQQVRRKLCQHLPKELKEYLSFITNTKISEAELESEQNSYSNSQNHEQSSYLFGNPNVESEKPKTEVESKADSLKHLLDIYNKMDETCKERAAPVKEYIEQHLRTLQTFKRDVRSSVGNPSKTKWTREDINNSKNTKSIFQLFTDLFKSNKQKSPATSEKLEEANKLKHRDIKVNQSLNKSKPSTSVNKYIKEAVVAQPAEPEKPPVQPQQQPTESHEEPEQSKSSNEEENSEPSEDEESQMIEKDLELLGLGKKKHNFRPKFSLDNMVEGKLQSKSLTEDAESDEYVHPDDKSSNDENISLEKKNRGSINKREAGLDENKWKQSDKYTNLVQAVQELQHKQNSQDRIARMYGAAVDSEEENRGDMKDINFEKPVVYSLN